MADTWILVYGVLSIAFGGVAATVESWDRPPTMLDRADGRGKFASPRSNLSDAILIGVFVMLLWPLLLIAALIDRMPRKD